MSGQQLYIPNQNSGRILGLLFLGTMFTGGAGTALRGLSGAEIETIEFVTMVSEASSQMKNAIYLDMMGSAIAVGIAIFLFPFVRKVNLRLSLAYLSIACINFVIITMSNVLHIGLLSVAADYTTSQVGEGSFYVTLGKLFFESYYWVHFLMLMMYSIGGWFLFYFMYASKLIPSWLAIWGIVANVIVFAGGALQIVDLPASIYMFIQNGIFMIVLAIWLLVRGFQPSSY